MDTARLFLHFMGYCSQSPKHPQNHKEAVRDSHHAQHSVSAQTMQAENISGTQQVNRIVVIFVMGQ